MDRLAGQRVATNFKFVKDTIKRSLIKGSMSVYKLH